ncbi:MAG: membrane protein insertase YidC [Acidobacteriota bacterium]
MEKRLFIAVMISIAFLFAWSTLVPKFFPDLVKPRGQSAPAASAETPAANPALPRPDEVRSASTVPAAGPAKPSAVASTVTPVVAPVQAGREIRTVIETPLYAATFSNRGAQLISFRLKEYKDDGNSLVELVKRRDPRMTDFPFSIESGDPNVNQAVNGSLYVVEESTQGTLHKLHYKLITSSGVTAEKSFELTNAYQFGFSVAVRGTQVPYRLMVGPGIQNVASADKDTQFVTTGNGVVLINDSFDVLQREKAPSLKTFVDSPQFVGIEDNYFLAVLQPTHAGEALFRRTILPATDKGSKGRHELFAGVNSAQGSISGKAYFGPKQADLLGKYGLNKTLKFGIFDLISRFLLVCLIWIHSFTKNYGWAIVVLTVLIKLVLYPLQHKSIVSMKKMQKLQPKVNALKDRYKKAKSDAEQRQKMNAEMMKLYQQEGVNPMSGCLPIVLQLPILWGFYSLLSHAIELRNAGFMLWITDLSAKDPYYITPILMTITMFIQQVMTPTTADPAQKRIFMVMPLIFGWIFKEFPSGLVLYWLVQNILTIAQQMIMNRYWKEHPIQIGSEVKGAR